ncbi:unnamed protein product [Paramecium sonneborni]|uniref:Uncharacterized protein n=1 Tax=Paramecium sonneborni TaxID=65129 RepID=A0A8S1MVW1_9CILI|nr:unnamed protein product [Paramecium sonneborni]
MIACLFKMIQTYSNIQKEISHIIKWILNEKNSFDLSNADTRMMPLRICLEYILTLQQIINQIKNLCHNKIEEIIVNTQTLLKIIILKKLKISFLGTSYNIIYWSSSNFQFYFMRSKNNFRYGYKAFL